MSSLPMISFFATCLISTVAITSCGSHSSSSSNTNTVKPVPKVAAVTPTPKKPTSKQALARKILNHPKIDLYGKQVSGVVDKASSRHNIASTAAGYSARRSTYGTARGGYVKLDSKMLETMLYLADVKGYRFNVTSIAGGSHSSNSRHYVGTAFDVSKINGVRVNSSNPYYKTFMRVCRSRGATEVLGPGDRGHSTHVHIAWPR